VSRNWLFLRGAWDDRTQKSIDDDDDMWLQLFRELAGDDNYYIWFKDNNKSLKSHGDRIYSCTQQELTRNKHLLKPDVIFARGGFDYYLPILNAFPKAKKIRYGAGCRYMPEKSVKYDLCIVDTEEQRSDILSVFESQFVLQWVKPAASHFRYMPEVKKEYDVCYIANGQQQHIKGVKWVYTTAPKDLKILHLGYPSSYNVPENVTQIRVDRKDMPLWINKCKVGIVPYWNSPDSEPRVIGEMANCQIKIAVGDTVKCNENRIHYAFNKNEIWEAVRGYEQSIPFSMKWYISDAVEEIRDYLWTR